MGSNRGTYIPYMSISHAIRQEIQRFEGVHPSIYAIYDLIELVPDPHLVQQIREHVVCIEDSFVDSQEWTLSRNVPELRLGMVGSLSSGKSALVHRYLTGSYMQEESPEGGRFKKEVVVDGQSYLLLIRDEGGPPELQFTSWVDAIIFVFSLENENSFSAIYNYYAKIAQYRNIQEIPLILVGTQDAICDSNPRVIEDARARKLATDLKRCAYYETCATYGLNVERVFQDACQKIVQWKGMGSRPTTPNNFVPRPFTTYMHSPTNGYSNSAIVPPHSPVSNSYHQSPVHVLPQHNSFVPAKDSRHSALSTSSSASTGLVINQNAVDDFRNRVQERVAGDRVVHSLSERLTGGGGAVAERISQVGERFAGIGERLATTSSTSVNDRNTVMNSSGSGGSGSEGNAATHHKFIVPGDNKENIARTGGGTGLTGLASSGGGGGELPTPSSTPTSVRKNRRRSNLFTPSGKGKNGDEKKNSSNAGSGQSGGSGGVGAAFPGGEVGSGRSIPIRQGYLYKKSNKSFSKEWKKKYVALCEDGRMTYHPSLHDYMENIHGKEIPLQYVTVKVPGQGPRGMRTVPVMGNGVATNGQINNCTNSTSNLGENNGHMSVSNGKITDGKLIMSGYEGGLRDGGSGGEDGGEGGGQVIPPPAASKADGKADQTTPNVKKRHRRVKSSGVRGGGGGGAGEEEETFEFQIVSLDNKTWHFEAGSLDERDEWVQSIEQQILNSLQCNESSKSKGSTVQLDPAAIAKIRAEVAGNNRCVDCDSPNPDWASLNLGVLVCIECSGIHRNLGSHISRVRSLDLDEWPPGHLAVMTSLGNQIANSIWEHKITAPYRKPGPDTPREEKERYIKAKYERKEFVAPLPSHQTSSQYLVDSICRSDMVGVRLALSHCGEEEVNSVVSPRDARTPLHLAAALGHLAIAQLLIWSTSNVKAIDHDGRSCVSHARNSGAQDVVDLLLSAGCPDVSMSGTLPRRRGSVSANRSNKEVTSSVM